MPGLNDLLDSEDESDDSSDDSSEEYSDEDDHLLHGVCGEAPINADSDPHTCLIGKYIVKEFLLAKGHEKRLYTAEITAYSQETRKFTVVYHEDNVAEDLTRAETLKLHNDFESWYAKVSRNGQKFTRYQALPVVVGAYNKDKIVRRAKAANPMDLTQDSDDDNSETAHVRRGIVISKMKVAELRKELRELNENQTGTKLELQQRLCKHFGCTLPAKGQKVQGKHAANWKPQELPVSPAPFKVTTSPPSHPTHRFASHTVMSHHRLTSHTVTPHHRLASRAVSPHHCLTSPPSCLTTVSPHVPHHRLTSQPSHLTTVSPHHSRTKTLTSKVCVSTCLDSKMV